MTFQELLKEFLRSPEQIELEVRKEQALFLQFYDQAKETAECALKAYPMRYNVPEIFPGENQIISACISGFLEGLYAGYDLIATDLEITIEQHKGKTITIGE